MSSHAFLFPGALSHPPGRPHPLLHTPHTLRLHGLNARQDREGGRLVLLALGRSVGGKKRRTKPGGSVGPWGFQRQTKSGIPSEDGPPSRVPEWDLSDSETNPEGDDGGFNKRHISGLSKYHAINTVDDDG